MSFSKRIVGVLAISTFLLVSFTGFSKHIKKKVTKEIKSVFHTETFDLVDIHVTEEVNNKLETKIKEHTLFKILSNDQLIGYAYVDKAPSKTDEFDFLVLFDPDLIIKKTKILIYREDYGGEIGSSRWLKQFIGKSTNDRLQYEKDIIAISGATISANSMTIAVNNLLKSIDTLLKHNSI